jgi:thioredoxin-dependent peroxiredoxin
MSKIAIGKPVPDFKLPATGGKTVSLADLKGKNVVLYFYPKDKTPGCTLEGQNFRDEQSKFAKLNTVVLGISRDSVKSHESFKQQEAFNFDLLADEDEKICRMFDVIKLKNMYGKEVMGVERSTFLIDKKGVLRKEWRKVKVDSHIDEVLEAVKALAD